MLTHYIFVRRDLPLGVIAAMVTHAAGESAAYYTLYEDVVPSGIAVVLEAKNEAHLKEIETYLRKEGLQDYVPIVESSEPYKNQLMAIGLYPAEREYFGELLGKFQTLKTCLDNPSSS